MYLQQTIKQALERGEKLTVLDTLKTYGTYELRHYVAQLKKLGCNIKSEWQEGNGKRWKIYWLNKPNATV